jgi:hypothetical protein
MGAIRERFFLTRLLCPIPGDARLNVLIAEYEETRKWKIFHLQGWRIIQVRNQYETELPVSYWFLVWLFLWPYWLRQYVSQICQPTFSRLHGATSQETEIIMSTTVWASNPKDLNIFPFQTGFRWMQEEQCHEPSDFIKWGDFVNQLKHC